MMAKETLRMEHTSLVENGVDCGEEEFGNDFNASLEGDYGIACDHFDCAGCCYCLSMGSGAALLLLQCFSTMLCSMLQGR